MVFDFSKKWDKDEDLPTLNFEDGGIEKETHILNTHCGKCHYLWFTGFNWRDKFICTVYWRPLNQTVNPEFGEKCKYFRDLTLFFKKPMNKGIRNWMERINVEHDDNAFIKSYTQALRKIKWIERYQKTKD